MQVKIATIERDTDTQARSEIRRDVVEEYAQLLEDGVLLPPVTLYGTPEQSWIGDGWHRILAHEHCGRTTVNAIIHTGGKREAIECAIPSNSDHGLRRTNADKRRAVLMAMKLWPDESSRFIADKAQVSHVMVKNVRDETTGKAVKSSGKNINSSSPTSQETKNVNSPALLTVNTQEDFPEDEFLSQDIDTEEVIANDIDELVKKFESCKSVLSELERGVARLHQMTGDEDWSETIMSNLSEVRKDLDRWSRQL